MMFYSSVPDEDPTGPVFIKFPRSEQVDEGAKVVFSCELDSVQNGSITFELN